MEQEYKLQQLNNKIIKESQRFISKVIDFQQEAINQVEKLNSDVNGMVKTM